MQDQIEISAGRTLPRIAPPDLHLNHSGAIKEPVALGNDDFFGHEQSPQRPYRRRTIH
jgi:hypothetical protein